MTTRMGGGNSGLFSQVKVEGPIIGLDSKNIEDVSNEVGGNSNEMR